MDFFIPCLVKNLLNATHCSKMWRYKPSNNYRRVRVFDKFPFLEKKIHLSMEQRPYLPWRPYIGWDESQLSQYVPPGLDVSWGNSSHLRLRGVATGGSGWVGGQSPPPSKVADQLTLLKPRGADYAPHTTASPSGLKKLSTPLRRSVFAIIKIKLPLMHL